MKHMEPEHVSRINLQSAATATTTEVYSSNHKSSKVKLPPTPAPATAKP